MLHDQNANTLSLDGTWEFCFNLDNEWVLIQVPGCWESQGFSKSIEGPVRYRRTFSIPEVWSGKHVFIEFDAVSYACTVWANGVEVGRHRGMWTPFAVDITTHVKFGRDNLIELEVYKPGEKFPTRASLSGFLPDVALVFGGIWQPVRLAAKAAVIEDLYIDPDLVTGDVELNCRPVVFNSQGESQLKVTIKETEFGAWVDEKIVVVRNELSRLSVHIPKPVLWSHERPNLYEVCVQLILDGKVVAEKSEHFGFRRLSTSGYQLTFNDEPICLRGVLSWGWDPDLISPAISEDQIRSEFRRVKSMGFNLVKLCLFIPNPLYYRIADEEGMFLWQEWPLWIPDAPVTDGMRQNAPAEYADYMRLARNHPSIIIYSLGCELKNLDIQFMDQLNRVVRGMVKNVLFCDNSGSSEIWSSGLHVDFADFSDYHIYSDLQDFEPILAYYQRDWMVPRPWLSGEFNDSDTFRDLKEIIAANQGVKPWWITKEVPLHATRTEVKALTEELELLEQANLGVDPKELIQISYNQSWAVRKYILELLRRRANTGGYVITGIRDTPISTSGIFDDFNRPKWAPDEFTLFNADRVLTYDVDRRARWPIRGEHTDRIDRANWWAGEPVRIYLILNNAGEPLQNGSNLSWRVLDLNEEAVASGMENLPADLPRGIPREIATLTFQFPLAEKALEYRLEASIEGNEMKLSNYWPMWSYPKPGDWPENIIIDDPSFVMDDIVPFIKIARRVSNQPAGPKSEVVVSTALSPWVIDYLHGGGRVLLLQQGCGPLPARRGPFWREAIKIIYDHPIWDRFPHRGYTDMQFFSLATEVMFEPGCMKKALTEVKQVHSLMKRMDAREFYIHDYLLEAQVGKGYLLACALRLQGGDGAQPDSFNRNIAGYSLLSEMVKYLASK